jgi:hypothetical protein
VTEPPEQVVGAATADPPATLHWADASLFDIINAPSNKTMEQQYLNI